MPSGNAPFDRRHFLTTVAVGGSTLTAGWALRGVSHPPTGALAADGTPDATATRQAELTELDDLRTQVAECQNPTATATMTATSTPEPTATPLPPVAAGTPVQFDATFIIAALSIAPAMPPANVRLDGALFKVNLEVQNVTADAKKIPTLSFTLTDANGVQAGVASDLINDVVGVDALLAIAGNSTKDLALPFVFPDPTATDFILSSTEQPAFRVALAIQHNG